jgi:DNA-binding NtrC family response regulator
VLESGEFIKVGSSVVQKTDVRVLAATNVDLPKLVQQGKFREDLYFRLNTIPITVPALRDRKEDIPLLFRKFCVDFAERYKTSPIQLTDEARHLLMQYNWPGNIRQLKNIAEQASVLASSKLMDAPELSSFLPERSKTTLPALAREVNGEEPYMTDREILYKMIFDMKNDLNDLKRFVWSLSRGGKLEMEEEPRIPKYEGTPIKMEEMLTRPLPVIEGNPVVAKEILDTPVIIQSEQDQDYEEHSVEDTLSIADMEKELIDRALKKHKGKRKDAALDLGISERTLYRKIKEYDIDA